MPRSRDEIYDAIVREIEHAVSTLEAHGCSTGVPRVLDYILEAHALFWEALADDERRMFEEMFRDLSYAAHEARLMCQNLGAIRKDIEKYRDWKIKQMLEHMGRR